MLDLRWRARCLVLLFFLIPFIQSAEVDKDREVHAKNKEKKSQAKSFSRGIERPAREYDDVDPTFEVSVVGSMTGGQLQVDQESKIAEHIHARLEHLLRGARTEECRNEIIMAYRDYMGAQALERALPFETEKFKTQCKDPTNRPPVPSTGLLEPDEVKLVYVILAHEDAAQVVRLVNALDDDNPGGKEETRTWFIIHIDLKAQAVNEELISVFRRRSNVIMLPDHNRQDVAWGGFNVVQASLEAIRVALDSEIPFNWLWIISGTTYPIASNKDIRAKLASHHPESIFMESKPSSHKPASTTWHYFVECDSTLHRIGRNLPPRDIEMFVGSQWLAMPPAAARWLLDDKALVPKYWRYAKHIVVADENFLPTVFRNSPFCSHHVLSNLVHIQFDKYEHTLDREDRRADKCLMPNPDHCGRSPAIMTVDYLSVLEHSGMLFARKFDPNDMEVLDLLDKIRAGDIPLWRKGVSFDFIAIRSAAAGLIGSTPGEQEEGVGGAGTGELCLSLDDPPPRGARASVKTEAKMRPCSEADSRQIFKLGPCSSDGTLELGEGGRGYMKSTRGEVTKRSPSCSVKSLKGSCLDLLGEAKESGAPAISFKCHNRWNQFFYFGEGELEGHLLAIVPRHLAMADEITDGQLCLEAMIEEDDEVVVKTAECSPESATQKFSVMQLHLTALPDDITTPPPADMHKGEVAPNGGGCAAGEGFCPAEQTE